MSPEGCLGTIADWFEQNATSESPEVMEYYIYLLRVASRFSETPSPSKLRAMYRSASKSAPGLKDAVSAITRGRPLEALEPEEYVAVYRVLTSASVSDKSGRV